MERVREGLRAACPAFGFEAVGTIEDTPAEQLALTWRHDGHEARLEADLATYAFTIAAVDETGAQTARIDPSALTRETG